MKPRNIWAIAIGVVAGLLLAMGVVTYANAADLNGGGIFSDAPRAPASKSTVGFYLGLQAGGSIVSTEISDTSTPANSIDGAGSKGPVGGVHAGMRYGFGQGMFVGLEAFYNFQAVDFNVNGGGASLMKASMDHSYGLHAQLGMAVAGTKPYVLAGWRHTDVSWSGAIVVPPGTLPTSMTGFDVGGGIEIPLASHIDLGLQSVWTKYNQEDIKLGGQTFGHLQSTGLETTARINFKF